MCRPIQAAGKVDMPKHVENPTHAFNLPSPYQTELGELDRRQKMAELLQAQAFQPPEKFSYKGIDARVSPLSHLAKVLDKWTSARDQREILAERKALGEMYRKEGMDDMTRYAEMVGKPAVPAVPGQDAFTPMSADYFDREMGGASDFKLDAQGMVPAVAPVAARVRGQIDRQMIEQFKTPEWQRMALDRMIKQGELPPAFNLGPDQIRFQPQAGGVPPTVVARGAPKAQPTTNLNRLLRERDALPLGDPQREVYNEAIKKESETAPKNRPTAKDEAGILRYLDGLKEPVFDPKAVGRIPKDPKLAFDQEKTLRGEFTKGAGDFVKVRDAYNRIVASVKNPSAAGDLSLIFNYMKVLDPGSTVREGEFATAQNSAGVPDIVRARANSLLSGERLSDVQRNDFANRAKMLYTAGENQYKTHEARYRSLAKMYKLDPDKVAYGMGAVPDTSEELPPKGVLKEGVNTTFTNGQVWTLVNGAAKRVR